MRLLHENFESELSCIAEEAEEIRVLIAFLTDEGLAWLPQSKTPVSSWIVGTDLGITSPSVLRKQSASLTLVPTRKSVKRCRASAQLWLN